MIKKSFKTFLYLATFLILSQFAYALNIVELSPGYYPNTSRSRALSTADIYVGKPDLDPEIIANQKTLSVQQEDGTIVAVSQPIHTNAGGVPVYAGSPVVLLVEGDYSLKVLDSSGSQIYYVPSTAYEKYLVTGNYYYPDYSEADQGVVGGGETVTDILTEVGVTEKATMYFSHDSGGNTTTYTFTTNTTITDNFHIIIEEGAILDGVGTLTIDNLDFVKAHLSQQIFGSSLGVTITNPCLIHPKYYGVTADGSTDDTTAFQKMVTGIPDGCTIVIPEGTILLSNITSFDDFKMVGNKEKCILKHKAASSDHMLETTGNVEINGIQFDGNKANNTNRTMVPLYFSGDRLNVDDCIFENSTFAGIRFVSDEQVDIQNNLFENMDEHGGTAGQSTVAVYGTSTAACQIRFNNNNIIHGVPADADAAPGGIILSGTSMSIECHDNYFKHIGQRKAGNYIGNIDLYTDCDKSIIINNRIDSYYYVPFKLSNSGEVIISGNVIDKAADTSSESAIYLSYARTFGSSIDDWVITGNIIDCDAKGSIGILVNGDNTYNTSRVIMANNIIYNTKDDAVQILYEAREVVLSNNVFDTWGTSDNGIEIHDVGNSTATSVNVNENIFLGGGTNIPIYARTNVAKLHLNVRGNTFQDGTPAYFITLRDAESLYVVGNEFITTATSWQIDYNTVTSVRVENNQGLDKTVSTDATTLETYGVTSINSIDNKVDSTLPDGDFVGQIKIIVMINATNPSDITVTHHDNVVGEPPNSGVPTGDGEIALFNDTGEVWILMWTGTEWTTLRATCTF